MMHGGNYSFGSSAGMANIGLGHGSGHSFQPVFQIPAKSKKEERKESLRALGDVFLIMSLICGILFYPLLIIALALVIDIALRLIKR